MNEIRCRCVSDVILGVFRLIFFFFDFGTAWSLIRIKIGYLGGPQENPDKTSPKAPKNRPDKNSGFGPLQDQGVQGIIGGPALKHQ